MLTLIILSYILFFMTRIEAELIDCSCTQPESEFSTGVNLLYYKCDNETSARIPYPILAPEEMLDVLKTDIKTVIYVFGYTQYPDKSEVQIMTKALCDGGTDNVVLLDWSKYSNGSYKEAFENAQKVGALFARSMQILVSSGFNVSNLYVIGTSLGAHIASFVGKCTNFTIPRITGLDPANPVFSGFIGCYLTSNDATWVDVIHTDMTFGYGISPFSWVGTAQFFPNGGHRPQPNCTLLSIPFSDEDFCSHRRSVELYAKLKHFPNKYIATQCSSYASYNLGLCKFNEQSHIGYYANNVTGSFYFKTI